MDVAEVELTAAQVDAEADKLLEQMKANNWQVPAETAKIEAPAEVKPQESIQADPEPVKDGQSEAQPKDLQALAEIAKPQSPEIKDPLQFNIQLPADYKVARATLLIEKAEALKKMMAGEIDADEYAAVETKVLDGLEDLSAQRIRAETLAEVNTQTAASTRGDVLRALMIRAKDDIAYATDSEAQGLFDRALDMEMSDPANVGKPFAAIADAAHAVVLYKRGIQAKPATNTPPKREAPNTPVTLGGLPNAGAGGEKTVTQVLSGLTGHEFDKAFDALSKDQQEKFLKQA